MHVTGTMDLAKGLRQQHLPNFAPRGSPSRFVCKTALRPRWQTVRRIRTQKWHTIASAQQDPDTQITVPEDNVAELKAAVVQQLCADGWSFVPVTKRQRLKALSEPAARIGLGVNGKPQWPQTQLPAAAAVDEAVRKQSTTAEQLVASTSGVQSTSTHSSRGSSRGRHTQRVYDQIQVAQDKDVTTLARTILNQLARDNACFVAASDLESWRVALQAVTTARKIARKLGHFDLEFVPESAISSSAVTNNSGKRRRKMQLYVRRTAALAGGALPSPASVLPSPWPATPDDFAQCICSALTEQGAVTLRCGGTNLSVDAVKGLVAARQLLRQQDQDLVVAPNWFVEEKGEGRVARMDLTASIVKRKAQT